MKKFMGLLLLGVSATLLLGSCASNETGNNEKADDTTNNNGNNGNTEGGNGGAKEDENNGGGTEEKEEPETPKEEAISSADALKYLSSAVKSVLGKDKLGLDLKISDFEYTDTSVKDNKVNQSYKVSSAALKLDASGLKGASFDDVKAAATVDPITLTINGKDSKFGGAKAYLTNSIAYIDASASEDFIKEFGGGEVIITKYSYNLPKESIEGTFPFSEEMITTIGDQIVAAQTYIDAIVAADATVFKFISDGKGTYTINVDVKNLDQVETIAKTFGGSIKDSMKALDTFDVSGNLTLTYTESTIESLSYSVNINDLTSGTHSEYNGETNESTFEITCVADYKANLNLDFRYDDEVSVSLPASFDGYENMNAV